MSAADMIGDGPHVVKVHGIDGEAKVTREGPNEWHVTVEVGSLAAVYTETDEDRAFARARSALRILADLDGAITVPDPGPGDVAEEIAAARNLLAVIHRDGGHRFEVGLAAYAEAEALVVRARLRGDGYRAQAKVQSRRAYAAEAKVDELTSQRDHLLGGLTWAEATAANPMPTGEIECEVCDDEREVDVLSGTSWIGRKACPSCAGGPGS